MIDKCFKEYSLIMSIKKKQEDQDPKIEKSTRVQYNRTNRNTQPNPLDMTSAVYNTLLDFK